MKYTFAVKGLDCPHCSFEIENDLKKIKGISNAAINLVTQILTVETELSYDQLFSIVSDTVHSHEPEIEVSSLDSLINTSVSFGANGDVNTYRVDNCTVCRNL